MKDVKLTVDPAYTVGVTDPRIFGSFIEHIGRAVYGGVYEPGHPTADENGFRKDVEELCRQLNVPIVRYPGGNFVSGYRWTDGIGPKENRPRRVDLAWRTTETNQCGTDDFTNFCKSINSVPLMTVNLGTAGVNEARDLVEYCNMESGTYFSDLRIANGYKEPHKIKTWCLGNEMDGVWQIGHKEAYEYGRLACEASKIMKWVDPSIETVICGSSSPDLQTFPMWEETVLDCAYENVDYISLHRYYSDARTELSAFLASPVDAEKYIETVIRVCDFVKAKKRSRKTMNLSFDEWNVWRHSCDLPRKDWDVAPHILEEYYYTEDALVVGGFLITLLRHCDRVKIACLAQLVNVIAPILTENADEGGRTLIQPIFYPFADVSNNGRGTVYDVRIDTPTYECPRLGEVRTVDAIAVDNENGEIAVFAVNRSLEESMKLESDLSMILGNKDCKAEYSLLTSSEPRMCNTFDNPDVVKPITKEITVENGKLSVELPKFSWNMIRIKK